jgi:hypothetical protein
MKRSSRRDYICSQISLYNTKRARSSPSVAKMGTYGRVLEENLIPEEINTTISHLSNSDIISFR